MAIYNLKFNNGNTTFPFLCEGKDQKKCAKNDRYK